MLAKRNRRDDTRDMLARGVTIDSEFSSGARVVVFAGDCLELLATIPDQTVQLAVTSPPYNIGKEYNDDCVSPTTWSSSGG